MSRDLNLLKAVVDAEYNRVESEGNIEPIVDPHFQSVQSILSYMYQTMAPDSEEFKWLYDILVDNFVGKADWGDE